MAKIVVLGGSGAVGRVAVRTLAGQELFTEVVAADINLAAARKVAAAAGKKVIAKKVDALNQKSLKAAIKGADLVLNCTGPFYKFALPVLKTVIASRINYVDVCDDVDTTFEVLKLDSAAKRAGVKALIGMGSSPGATNVIARFAADNLLDQVDSIDIFHAHGGEPFEGEGVIGHRCHCMSIDIPMYLEGELKYVNYFGDDGVALRQKFNFPVIGEALLYPYPHPEQVTIPQYIKCRQVTNKGTVLPEPYYDLTRDVFRLGLGSREPLLVKGKKVVPYEFALAYIIRERERILKQTKFGAQRGCVTVIVKGKKNGQYQEFRASMASQSQALGEGTGIPAAMGCILMAQGKVKGPGVLPPEAAINPNDFLALLPQVMKLDAQKEGGKSFGGIIIEQVDAAGNVKKFNL